VSEPTINTRLPPSVIKSWQTATTFVSYWSTLVIQTVACSEVIYVTTSDLLSTQSSSTNIAARRFSRSTPPFGTVFPHLYALILVLGLSSRLTM